MVKKVDEKVEMLPGRDGPEDQERRHAIRGYRREH